MRRDDKDLERAYAENVGREHRNLPDDHPDLWQWRYRGTKAERDALAESLSLTEEPCVIEGQADLFGDES